jgi:hypothetical protein
MGPSASVKTCRQGACRAHVPTDAVRLLVAPWDTQPNQDER